MDYSVPSKYFRTHVTLLKMAGISVVGNEGSIYRIYSLLNLSLICLYPILNMPTFLKYSIRDNVDTATFQIGFSMAACKILVVFLQRKRLGRLLVRIEKEPFIADFDRGGAFEQKAVINFLTVNDVQAKIYGIPIFTYVSIVLLITIIRRLGTDDPSEWKLPYTKFVSINVLYSPIYEVASAYQILAATWLISTFITIDLIITGVLCNISYQLKMLQNSISRLGLCHGHSTLQKKIANMIQYHVEIINIAKEVEDLFNIQLLLVFMNSILLLSIIIFVVTSVSSFESVMRKFVELLAAVFQVFVTCYWGERVQKESENVGRAAYNVITAFPNSNFQRALNLVVLRGQRPLKITAGKFTDVCMTTFAWILRASYSTFMLIRNTQH